MTMKTWDYASAGGGKKETGCCNLDSFNDARSAAVEHGFPHYTFLLNEESNDVVGVPAVGVHDRVGDRLVVRQTDDDGTPDSVNYLIAPASIPTSTRSRANNVLFGSLLSDDRVVTIAPGLCYDSACAKSCACRSDHSAGSVHGRQLPLMASAIADVMVDSRQVLLERSLCQSICR